MKLKAALKRCRVETADRLHYIEKSISRLVRLHATNLCHRGMESLPDELLCKIFELHQEADREEGVAVGLVGEGQTHRGHILARTCSRFRHIALRLPVL